MPGFFIFYWKAKKHGLFKLDFALREPVGKRGWLQQQSLPSHRHLFCFCKRIGQMMAFVFPSGLRPAFCFSFL